MEKLRKGDFISIHWYGDDNAPGFAYDLRYEGRNRENGYIFKSLVYGWHYIVDCKKETVCCDYDLSRKYKIDSRTGWTRYLPD